ncbi:winged helix-turn-helix transcriptional regulator [Myxococcota bacterium]|nr:winged helix-turn-helix transcriptional regulator [Myxococcota bacterium]
MLQYLFPSSTRRKLLLALWGQDIKGSASELARLLDLSFAAVYTELISMKKAGLAVHTVYGSSKVFAANLDHPKASLLRSFLGDGDSILTIPDRDEEVRAFLHHFGAPLAGNDKAAENVPSIEDVILEGCSLSHRDAAVARIMPVFIWNNRTRTDSKSLMIKAQKSDEKPTLGFFLDLCGELSGDASCKLMAESLVDRRRRRIRDFFYGPKTKWEDELAEINTPKIAKDWLFRMNMGLDSIRSTWENFASK